MLEEYTVSDDPGSIAALPVHEGTNAARFALAGALGTPAVPPAPPVGLRRVPVAGPPGEAEQYRYLRAVAEDFDADRVRRRAWADLPAGRGEARLALLVAGTCSPLERESAAAAVAMLDDHVVPAPGGHDGWDGPRWAQRASFVVRNALLGDDPGELLRVLAATRVADAARSADPIVRGFAQALALRPAPSAGEVSGALAPLPPAPVESMIVHGTWGWAGEWWYPGGDFHRYLSTLRPGLYAGGREFSWSGALDAGVRALAATRLRRWAAPAGIDSLFALSFGADVAAQAMLAGTPVAEPVLLSAPATPAVLALAASGRRLVDIRLDFDIVLALARQPQRVGGPGVVSVIVERALWEHGATYLPEFWREERIAARAGLVRVPAG